MPRRAKLSCMLGFTATLLLGTTLVLGQSVSGSTRETKPPTSFPPESGVLYFATRGQPLTAPPPPPEGTFAEPPLIETSTAFTVNAVNDSNVDVEPSVVAVRPSSQDRTTTVYIKYVANPQLGPSPLLFYSSTTDFLNFTRSSIPGVVGYYWLGDPWLDANVWGTGIAQNRVYLAGLAFNPIVSATCTSPYLNPSAIPVWHSDNGGTSWSAATLVETNTNTTIQLDKPAIAVSGASNSAGRVYVVWAKRNYSTCSTEIRFAQWSCPVSVDSLCFGFSGSRGGSLWWGSRGRRPSRGAGRAEGPRGVRGSAPLSFSPPRLRQQLASSFRS